MQSPEATTSERKLHHATMLHLEKYAQCEILHNSMHCWPRGVFIHTTYSPIHHYPMLFTFTIKNLIMTILFVETDMTCVDKYEYSFAFLDSDNRKRIFLKSAAAFYLISV